MRDLDPTGPTTVHVTVCDRIEPDTRRWDGLDQVADRFQALTGPLPLAGAKALEPRPGGELALIAHLRSRAPWMTAAIDLLDEQLRANLWAGRPWVQFRPMLMSGPPGAGKSHFARLVSEFARTGHAVLSMAGMWDASLLTGSPRSYTSPSPSFPAVVMCRTGTANPIVVADEVDKTAIDRRQGEPLAALLTLIEPSTAGHYFDKCLLAHCDLSHASWIFTANDPTGLPAPFRSRVDLVEVAGPTDDHFEPLLATLTADLAREWRTPVPDLPDLLDGTVDVLRARFSKSRSVRALQRELAAALMAGMRLTQRTLN